MVVGNFRSEAECEVLPVSHLVFVHGTYCFNNLNNTDQNKTHKCTTPFGGLFTIILDNNHI